MPSLRADEALPRSPTAWSDRVRRLLGASERSPAEADSETETPSTACKCPCCGGRMIIVETFAGARPTRPLSPRIRIDTS